MGNPILSDDVASALRVRAAVAEQLAYDEATLRERIVSLEEDREIVLEMYRGAMRALVDTTKARDREREARGQVEREFSEFRARIMLGERPGGHVARMASPAPQPEGAPCH